MNDPKTFPEKLDAAQDGAQFGAVLNQLFLALEQARNETDKADDEGEL